MYSDFMFLDQFLFELSCKNTHTCVFENATIITITTGIIKLLNTKLNTLWPSRGLLWLRPLSNDDGGQPDH